MTIVQVTRNHFCSNVAESYQITALAASPIPWFRLPPLKANSPAVHLQIFALAWLKPRDIQQTVHSTWPLIRCRWRYRLRTSRPRHPPNRAYWAAIEALICLPYRALLPLFQENNRIFWCWASSNTNSVHAATLFEVAHLLIVPRSNQSISTTSRPGIYWFKFVAIIFNRP